MEITAPDWMLPHWKKPQVSNQVYRKLTLSVEVVSKARKERVISNLILIRKNSVLQEGGFLALYFEG